MFTAVTTTHPGVSATLTTHPGVSATSLSEGDHTASHGQVEDRLQASWQRLHMMRLTRQTQTLKCLLLEIKIAPPNFNRFVTDYFLDMFLQYSPCSIQIIYFDRMKFG